MSGLTAAEAAPGTQVMLTKYRMGMMVVALEDRVGQPGALCAVHGVIRWFPLSNLSPCVGPL